MSDGRRAGSSGKGRLPAHSRIDRRGIGNPVVENMAGYAVSYESIDAEPVENVELRPADPGGRAFRIHIPDPIISRGGAFGGLAGGGEGAQTPGISRLRKIFQVCDRPAQVRRRDDVACRGQTLNPAPETADKQASMGRFSGCRGAARYFPLVVTK